MANQQLLDYVRDQLRTGATADAIRAATIQVGWRVADVDEVFAVIKGAPATPAPAVATKVTPPVSTVVPTAATPAVAPLAKTQPQLKPIDASPVSATNPAPLTTPLQAPKVAAPQVQANPAPALTPLSSATIPPTVHAPITTTMPVQTPVPARAPVVAAPVSTATPVAASAASTSNPVNKFLVVLVVLLVLGGLGGGGYYYYTTQQEISALSASAAKATSDLATQTQQNVQLQQQVAQLSCKGVWSNNTCMQSPVSIIATPYTGPSPLKVTFTVRVPDMNYSVDYGDGNSGKGVEALNVQNGGSSCVTDALGLCTITLSHTYSATSTETKFTANLIQKGAVAASVLVTATKK